MADGECEYCGPCLDCAVMPNILSKNNNQLRDLRLYLFGRNGVKHLARCV